VLTNVAPGKSHIPVLDHVRLSVNGTVKLEATDLEVSAVIDLPRQWKGGKFQALLPAKRLAEYVRKSTFETTVFENESAFKTNLDGAASLIGGDIKDFPETLGQEGTLISTFAAGELATALRLAKFAASYEVVRYALTGVLFEVRNAGLSALVASDGKRLSAARIKAKSDRHVRVVVPLHTAELLEKVSAQADPALRVEFRATLVKATDVKTGVQSETDTIQQIHFKVGPVSLFSRIIEGHFPDWELVVPNNGDKVFVIDRATLAQEIERVKQACTDKTLATKFTFEAGKLTLFSKTQDVGESRAVLAADGKDEISIVFNPLYVLDYLAALPKGVDRVTLRVKDKTAPGLFQSVKGHDYILMPLTINV
jgi:DNA polymerase-3 subunit beta